MMLSPKEKAEELVDKFKYISYDLDDIDNHKECALIAVDEMKYEINRFADNNFRLERLDYLEKVKQEIEKL